MTKNILIEEALTFSVIGAFFEVYNTLGFSFIESIYTRALERELLARNHHVAREMSVRIFYKCEEIATQRLDMIVDGKLVVEVKAADRLHVGAARQVYNYLRATNLEVGLLLHFGHDPKFHRLICQNPPNPPDLIDPPT